jgi:hypothetical protein
MLSEPDNRFYVFQEGNIVENFLNHFLKQSYLKFVLISHNGYEKSIVSIQILRIHFFFFYRSSYDHYILIQHFFKLSLRPKIFMREGKFLQIQVAINIVHECFDIIIMIMFLDRQHFISR